MINKTLSILLGQQPTQDILAWGVCPETIHAIGLLGCVFATIVFLVLVNECKRRGK